MARKGAGTATLPRSPEDGPPRVAPPPKRRPRAWDVESDSGVWRVETCHDWDRRVPTVTVRRPDLTIACACWTADLYGRDREEVTVLVAEGLAVALRSGWRPPGMPEPTEAQLRWRAIVAQSKQDAQNR